MKPTSKPSFLPDTTRSSIVRKKKSHSRSACYVSFQSWGKATDWKPKRRNEMAWCSKPAGGTLTIYEPKGQTCLSKPKRIRIFCRTRFFTVFSFLSKKIYCADYVLSAFPGRPQSIFISRVTSTAQPPSPFFGAPPRPSRPGLSNAGRHLSRAGPRSEAGGAQAPSSGPAPASPPSRRRRQRCGQPLRARRSQEKPGRP